MSNRKEAEKIILNYIEKITKSKENVKLYTDLFSKMNNKEFDEFMCDLRDKKTNLQVICPHGKDSNLDYVNNLNIAKSMGKDFMQRLVYKSDGETPTYKTPHTYLVFKLPVNRVSQLLDKKISYAQDNKVIDNRTGQVTGKSLSATLTNPEVSMLSAYNFDNLLKEFLNYRGGDIGGRTELSKQTYANGIVSMANMDHALTGVKSTQTLEQLYLSMGIRIRLSM